MKKPTFSMKSMNHPSKKTAILALRLDPEIKAAASVAAQRDHRTLTALVEVLILDHCKRNGIHVFQPRRQGK